MGTFEAAKTALVHDITDLKCQLEELRVLFGAVAGTTLEARLKKKEAELEAMRSRAAISLDILNGKIFLLYEHEEYLALVQPSDSTAAVVAKAQEYGAVITKVEGFGQSEKKEVKYE